MKLSTRSTYGMRALVELALAAGRGPMSAMLIATRQDLSVAYLEQLLHRLKKEALVKSVRGPRGGYVLAKEPGRITMAAVVDVLDGGNGQGAEKARRASSSRRAKAGSKDAPGHAQQIARVVWQCLHERIAQSLNAVTLEDLCDQVRAEVGEPLDHRYEFHI